MRDECRRGVFLMAKIIDGGFITDPNDPIFKEGWTVGPI